MSIQEQLVGKIQALMRARYGGVSAPERQQLFEAYDTDGDGFVLPPELEQLLTDADVGNRMTRGMWVKGVVAKLDTNRDGKISLEEFEAIIG